MLLLVSAPQAEGEPDRHTVKHPVMYGREDDVRLALEQPDEIRRSRSDPAMHLFYRAELAGRWTCAVAKRLND